MADLSTYPDSNLHKGGGTGVGPDRGAITGTSRWQKIVGIMGLVVVLAVGGDLYDVVTGGARGPGGGGSGSPGVRGPGGQSPPSDGTDSGGGGGHTPPPGTPRH